MANSVAAKPWWESKTQWGLLISTLGFLLQGFGVTFDTVIVTEIIWAFVQAIGLLLTFYGNIHRQAPIDMTKILPGITLESHD